MPRQAFGRLHIDPATNPAVLDTLTWAPDQAAEMLRAVPVTFWPSLGRALESMGSGLGIVNHTSKA